MVNEIIPMYWIIFIVLIVILAIFEIIMKGFAMWRASERKSKGWFWVLLVINTMGILPLIYLLTTSPKKKGKY